MQRITTTAIGHELERLARAIAPLLVATYAAGLCTGIWLHRLNDRLVATWLALLGLASTTSTTTAAPAPAPAHALVATLPVEAPPLLEALTVPQLRTLARHQLGSSARIGGRRIAQARRAELVLALAAA